MQTQWEKKLIDSFQPIYSYRCTDIYSEDWWTHSYLHHRSLTILWHSNSITLGRNHTIQLYACLQQALLMCHTEDSPLLGAPAGAFVLLHPTGTPQHHPPCSVCPSEPWDHFGVSPWPPLELQALLLREDATLKRQKVLCFAGEGPSWLLGVFCWAFPCEACEQVSEPAAPPRRSGQWRGPTWHCRGRQHCCCSALRGLHRTQVPSEKQSISWLC